ncbi:MAG: hypothetical protein Kow00127_16070 [Bacteroidales bacterium]
MRKIISTIVISFALIFSVANLKSQTNSGPVKLSQEEMAMWNGSMKAPYILSYYNDPPTYYWNDAAVAMRFTATMSNSLLEGVDLMFYPPAAVNTPDVWVSVTTDNGGLPDVTLGAVMLPYASIIGYPDFTYVDLSSLNLVFNSNEDFHIVVAVANSADLMPPVSDDGVTTPWNRASYFDFTSGTFVKYSQTNSIDPGFIFNAHMYSMTNNALHFDGVNDFVDATATATGLPQGNAARTMEAWIKTTANPGFQNIYSWGRTSTNMRSSIGLRIDHLAFVGAFNDLDGSIIINDGNWHHVAVSFDGSMMSLYVDGVLDISSAMSLNTTDQNLLIGTIALPYTGEYWEGWIDEVRIWDVAKTQAEIQTLMNTPVCSPDPNLIVNYNFNQGVAGGNNQGVTTLADNSGNGYDGMLMNFGLNGATSNWVISSMNVPACAATNWTGTVSSDWNDAGNWDSGIVPNASTNVVIPSGTANQPVIAGAADCYELTVMAGASLTIQSNASATGTLINGGTITNNGTIYIQRYFSGNDPDWHLVSAPLMYADAGTFSGMYLQSFDETTNSYSEITNPATSLPPLQGYGLYSTLGASNTVTFNGTPNSGTQSTVFTANNMGWNLLGNPYPSSIDWERVVIPAGLSNEVHYIDAASGNDLSYVKGVGGTGAQYIPPMQGFFVKASAAGNFTLDGNERSHNGSAPFYKNSNPDRVVLKASNGQFADETWVHINSLAGVEHDGQFDAYKRISLSNPNLPQIFSVTPSGDYLSINGIPEEQSTIIGFSAVNSGSFTIEASETGEFAQLVLEDTFTGAETDLLNNSYTFSYSAGDVAERFILHFSPLALEETSINDASVYAAGNQVYVTLAEGSNGQVEVFNTMGQLVNKSSVHSGTNTITLSESGVFVVKATSNNSTIVKKVIIR